MHEDELLGAQMAFALASRLVFQEPEDGFYASLIKEDVFEGAPFGQDDPAVGEGLAMMRSWCLVQAGLDQEEFARAMRDMSSDWFMLLVGPGVPKAPNWAGFYLSVKSELMSQITLDVRRLYRRWGFVPDGVNKEPDDNLGILLGFLAQLIAVEASCVGADECADEAVEAVNTHVAAAGSEADAQAARDAQEQVLVSYLLPWINTWRWHVAKHAHNDFLKGLGELVFGLCRAYAERFDMVFIEDGISSRFCRKGE